MSSLDNTFREFLTETHEGLAQLDLDVVELERSPDGVDLINRIFRTIHTIKGSCGFLDLHRLERVAHATETVLMQVREHRLPVNRQVIDAVLGGIDAIKSIVQELERTRTEPQGDDVTEIARLEACLAIPVAEALPPAVVPPSSRADTPSNQDLQAIDASEAGARGTLELFDTDEVFAIHPSAVPTPPAAPPALPITPATTASTSEPDVASIDLRSESADSSLRVNVVLLDSLMNLVGELVLARNQLLQLSTGSQDPAFDAPVQHLKRVTTDLQEAVMKTRMQPVGSAWNRLPRLVRDLAASSGKSVTLEMHGQDTELDRQILQAIQDPLTHMVRNAVDHGIEDAEERRQLGKPARGTVRLTAFHEGGHVILEISDDGAGINVERVRQKAVERGLVGAEAAATLSDAQVLRFVFEPGFSTARAVTNVSGRGVGMDVVRCNVERIGGTVDLRSRVGAGTTVRIKIPLTLAIVSALVVAAGSEMFAIPQIGIVELVRVTEDQRDRIETLHGARFYRLRDTLLPLINLRELLALGHSNEGETIKIVVCQVGPLRFGLVVDDVFDTQEIVVKPLGRLVKSLSVYAGCTILGDGRVIMILDTTGIASMSIPAGRREQMESERPVEQSADDSDRESILLVDAGYPALQAVPLARVTRLEEFPSDQIEEADGRLLVQYRGALLPILPAHPDMDVRARSPRSVVVFSHNEQSVGLAVESIHDIVESRIVVESAARRTGVLGVSVIAGRATEIIDTAHFLKQSLANDVGGNLAA